MLNHPEYVNKVKLRDLIYRQDAAKRRQPVFKFTQWPKISILLPSGKTELDRKMVDTF